MTISDNVLEIAGATVLILSFVILGVNDYLDKRESDKAWSPDTLPWAFLLTGLGLLALVLIRNAASK